MAINVEALLGAREWRLTAAPEAAQFALESKLQVGKWYSQSLNRASKISSWSWVIEAGFILKHRKAFVRCRRIPNYLPPKMRIGLRQSI